MLAEAAGVGATAAGLARSWPQVRHILNRPDVSGVSAPTWLFGISGAITWLTIGIVERIAATIVFNSLNLVGVLTVLTLLIRRGRLAVHVLAATVAGTVAVNLAALTVFGTVGPCVLGVTSAVLSFLPQAVGVLGRSTAGVSALSWMFALATSALWSVYGLLIDEFVLVAPGLVMVPAAAVIIWRVTVGARTLGRLPC